MESVFLKILNMNVTAVFVILAVCVFRLFLKKAPKVFSYALWSVVFFRLICPFSFESVWSLLPVSRETIPENIAYMQVPEIQSGIDVIDRSINLALPEGTPDYSANPLQIYIFAGSIIWLLGFSLFLLYSIIMMLRFRKRLKAAKQASELVYELEGIGSPFVFGFFKAKIYLPPHLDEKDKNYILAHERTHIKRQDYRIKPIAFLIVCVHWFNPFVWLAFYLMEKDMERSCDEAVMNLLGKEIKKEYSSSLLSLSAGKRVIGGSPLLFGEKDLKGRIRNILRYKRPAFLILAVSTAAVTAACILLLFSPSRDDMQMQPVEMERRKQVENTSNTAKDGEAAAGPAKKEEEITGVLHVEEELAKLFEDIMKNPKTSSNPQDYLKNNADVFKKIIEYGDSALIYCFTQFEEGEETGLKGWLMMAACRELMEQPQTDLEYTDGQTWYEEFKKGAYRLFEENSKDNFEKYYPQAFLLLQLLEGKADDRKQEIRLPAFSYPEDDEIEALVYHTEVEENKDVYWENQGFLIPAITFHGTYEEEDRVKVFITVYSEYYYLSGKELRSIGGSVVPKALTYRKEGKTYELEESITCSDGSDFIPSIRDYCTMPASGKTIPGLAEKIVEAYGDNASRISLMQENLIAHLNACGQTGVFLADEDGGRRLLN